MCLNKYYKHADLFCISCFTLVLFDKELEHLVVVGIMRSIAVAKTENNFFNQVYICDYFHLNSTLLKFIMHAT